jgi:hypothetical protein
VAGFHICNVDRSGATIVLVTLLENSHSEDYDGQELHFGSVCVQRSGFDSRRYEIF